MTYVAMVVVVEADDVDAAYEGVVQQVAGVEDVQFVGSPWEVKSLAETKPEVEFDTLDCLDQHPDHR